MHNALALACHQHPVRTNCFFLLLSFKFVILLKNIALSLEFWVCMSLSYVSVANFKAFRIDNFYTFTFHTFTLSHFYSFTLSSVSHFSFPFPE